MTVDARTAYGLGFAGLDADPALTGPPNPAAPTITVTRAAADPEPFPGRFIDQERAAFRFLGGMRLSLRRSDRSARYVGEPTGPDEWIHPCLGPAAIVHNRWLGREVFHAGVFEVDGKAWVALGPRTAGKSSLLAQLDARGFGVLPDDIAVCSADGVFSGPRCIDLREPIPGAARAGVPARGALRHRLHLSAAPFCVPLGGWLFLGWTPRVQLERVATDALLGMLARRRLHTYLPSDPEVLLALAAVPAWHFRRPKDWAHAGTSLSALLGTISASSSVSA